MFDTVIDDRQKELINRIAAREREKSAAAAHQARDTVELANLRLAAEIEAGVPAKRRGMGLGSEVALARLESPNQGGRHLGFAKALVNEMPRTLTALETGVLTEWRATLIVRESACLSLEDRRTLDEELCGDPAKLVGWGNTRIEAEAKKIAYRLDPEAIVERIRRAPEESGVTVRPAPDCMSHVSALMPMAQGVAVYAALKKEADTTFDGRSRGKVMADTLYERVTGLSADVPVPVDVGIVIDDEALLAGGDAPAELVDYGPIPAEIAREMVRDAVDDERSHATLRRLYCHPRSRAMVKMESRRRTFPPSLATLIRLRDGGICRTPYCNARIRHIDHATPDRAGGATSGVNGNGRCARCNYDKDAPGWTTW